jgi:hypothetical protein
MSDIQRWYIQNPPGQPTEFVSYADHVAHMEALELRLGRHYEQVTKAAVAEAEQRVIAAAVAAVEATEWVGRVLVRRDDVIAAIKAVSDAG